MGRDKKDAYLFKPLAFSEVVVVDPNGTPAACLLHKPEARSGHRTVCDDANLFSFGGYLKTESAGRHQHRLFEELWCFNFAENSWKFLPTSGVAPKELASHCAFLYGNFLHVFGGTGVSFGESTSNTLNTCDLRTLRWDEVQTTGELPVPQYGQAILLDDRKREMYVIGGTTGFDFSMDIHKLNLVTKTWEVIFACKGDQSDPLPRYRHEVAFDGKNIYVFGGGTSSTAYTLKTIPTFNLDIRKWSAVKTRKNTVGRISNGDSTEVPGYPYRRKCHSSVQLGNDVYICGGCNNTRVYSDIWKFNIPSRQWTFLPIAMPMPLSFHTASLTSSGCMYIFGGVTNIERGQRTNKIFKIWLKIPKLQEMCWEALLSCNSQIKKSKRNALMEMGIPMDFVRRVHPSPPGGIPDRSVESVWESDLLTLRNSSCDAPNPQGCLNSFV